MKSLLTPLLMTAMFASALPVYADEAALKEEVDALKKELAEVRAREALVAQNIGLYDKMDLVAFTNHDMDLVAQLHSDNVKVYNPDGSLTHGMTPAHRNELQWFFDTFPDITINQHPIKMGADDWTAGVSITEGTWSKPMTLADGQVLQPNGKRFKIRIATFVKWQDGRIEEEHLFWDNADFFKQLGIGG